MASTRVPQLREWTVFCAIVQRRADTVKSADDSPGCLDVVAIGTGTKCMGHRKLDERSGILADSHAEVGIRRRGDLYYVTMIVIYLGGGSKEICLPTVRSRRSCPVARAIPVHGATALSHSPTRSQRPHATRLPLHTSLGGCWHTRFLD